MTSRSCAQPGCSAASEPDAPVALCGAHLAAAAEWVGEASGVTEPLPAPCVACGSRLGVTYRSGRLCAVCEWRFGDVADGELAPPRVDVVYYLRFGERIKIGTTANPRQRFAQLRFDELLAFERGDRAVEQARHRQFAAWREGGEWFTASPSLVDHVALVAAGHPDPWALYARWRSEALALRVS
ncbi:GIY-YIG nuclease family protein [Frondihabitans australicus]|uniref:T5orf172 domain-containing protein n=1 Tax=Frondihabitans australicus TaxID=386892 RepID=A0A495IJ84_9MICO|nr:GIY-YIG nuclease family protein [Frondihabitans australicus]RKR75770.1 T5orf172 domain-containing protein [Frondihabitans australicus]